MARPDFSAVGFLVADVLGRPVRDLPPEGGATFVDEITITVAGTAGATAVDCAILGLAGRISARVGDDAMGRFLTREMERFGLDCRLVQTDPSLQTSCSMLPIRPTGERSAWFVPGASATFLPTEKERAAICDAPIVHIGGVGLLEAFDGAATVGLLQQAKAAGCITVFDLILADARVAALVEPLLPHLDYVVPSIEEARALSGMSAPEDVAQWFRARGAGHVILTMGGEGVFLAPRNGAAETIPAHRIDVVDTTGCGDSFTAGIIVGLHRQMGLSASARFANAVAAQVAMGLGSQGKLTSYPETKAFMAVAES